MKVASEDPLEKANAIAKSNNLVKLQSKLNQKWKGGRRQSPHTQHRETGEGSQSDQPTGPCK